MRLGSTPTPTLLTSQLPTVRNLERNGFLPFLFPARASCRWSLWGPRYLGMLGGRREGR